MPLSPAIRAGAAPSALGALLPFLRPYWRRIALALLLLLLAAGATLVFPLALKTLIDTGLMQLGQMGTRNAHPLRSEFMAIFAVAVALGAFSAGRFYMVSWLGERITADLRQAVYAHVLRQSPEFFSSTPTGEVLSRLMADTTLVQTVVGSSLSMGLRNLVMGLGAMGMLVWTNPYVMTQVLGILLLVVLPTMAFGRRVRRLSRASQDRLADSSAMASEVLNAVSLVQSFTAEEREANRFGDATDAAFATAVRRSKARSVLVAFIIIATSAALLWGLYQGTQAVLAGRITAGHLGQTVVYVIMLASSAAVLGEVYGDLLRAAGATERLMELLGLQSAIRSPAEPTSTPPTCIGMEVELTRVTLHYPARPHLPALCDVSFRVAPGETVALVGPSGAGKSTVLQLLQRFYDPDPTGGAVLLDGMDTRRWDLQALRSRIAVVPQDAVIFSTNALENIRYGRPSATDEEVFAAARSAHAHDFIGALPAGYSTHLGERGLRLSGGQRQRIGIARAMLKDAPLLLLDEATSALDSESERMVQAALEAVMQRHSRKRTTIVIAHRLATVQKSDRILVLDHGTIVEEGTHESLMALDGVYARLAILQFAA